MNFNTEYIQYRFVILTTKEIEIFDGHIFVNHIILSSNYLDVASNYDMTISCDIFDVFFLNENET